ncbi:hypothetical protein TNCT_113801 [Trichonephila clavata]|uniref:Uncharacterized protein n=1 Tax=Trichonephila clavata TaxID=2740835 RepID=A0A8X6EZZ9_TRICU|nr:hypothetical protein TNCT_113801 [Trichonephila clavata]
MTRITLKLQLGNNRHILYYSCWLRVPPVLRVRQQIELANPSPNRTINTGETNITTQQELNRERGIVVSLSPRPLVEPLAASSTKHSPQLV